MPDLKWGTAMTYNEQSRANLQPAWTTETAPRHPRKGGSWSIADYLRFVASGDHTTGQLRAIADDESEPHGRRAAARLMLDTADDDPRVRGAAFDRVANRLEGTPTQSHRVIDESVPDPQRVLAELQRSIVGSERRQLEAPATDRDV